MPEVTMCVEFPLCIPAPSIMVRSDTDVLKGLQYTRSASAPSDIQGPMDDSVLDIIRLQK